MKKSSEIIEENEQTKIVEVDENIEQKRLEQEEMFRHFDEVIDNMKVLYKSI